MGYLLRAYLQIVPHLLMRGRCFPQHVSTASTLSRVVFTRNIYLNITFIIIDFTIGSRHKSRFPLGDKS